MDDAAIDAELAIWESTQPPWERGDPLWTLLAYRLARYALHVARTDVRNVGFRVSNERRDQLLRAVASISANIGEGHSRPSARERLRYYSYAVGSAREASAWYGSITDALSPGTADARGAVLTRVRRFLLGLIRRSSDARWRT